MHAEQVSAALHKTFSPLDGFGNIGGLLDRMQDILLACIRKVDCDLEATYLTVPGDTFRRKCGMMRLSLEKQLQDLMEVNNFLIRLFKHAARNRRINAQFEDQYSEKQITGINDAGHGVETKSRPLLNTKLAYPKSLRTKTSASKMQNSSTLQPTDSAEQTHTTSSTSSTTSIHLATPSLRCLSHSHQSIDSSPRGCGWHSEGSTELARPSEAFETLRPKPAPPITKAISKSIRYLSATKTCHRLLLLGSLTIAGSLGVGIWRSQSLNDVSGGFSLAQYIWGIGIFVVGSMVVLHAKSCTCSQQA